MGQLGLPPGVYPSSNCAVFGAVPQRLVKSNDKLLSRMYTKSMKHHFYISDMHLICNIYHCIIYIIYIGLTTVNLRCHYY